MTLEERKKPETVKEIEDDLNLLSEKAENNDTKENIDAILWRLQKVWDSIFPIKTNSN